MSLNSSFKFADFRRLGAIFTSTLTATGSHFRNGKGCRSKQNLLMTVFTWHTAITEANDIPACAWTTTLMARD
ncbi:MAG: hypothetical protein ACI90E_002627 [Yoonia sp.]